jgi:uncharacterized glyoxalase superfamily protein PhnB
VRHIDGYALIARTARRAQNVDTALARLAAAGAPIVAEPEDQPWGERVARTCDPDGNLVYVGSAI